MARNNGRRSFLPVEKRSAGSGAVDPASPSGRYAEAPAAALHPLPRVENSRNPALVGGAMLISPILFFLMARTLLVARRAGPIRAGCVYRARLSLRSGSDSARELTDMLPPGRDGRTFAPEGTTGRPRLVAKKPLSGPQRAARRGTQPSRLSTSQDSDRSIGDEHYTAGVAGGRQEKPSQQRAATGDDTAADMVRGRERGMQAERRSIGASRTRKGRARSAAGDSIGDGKR